VLIPISVCVNDIEETFIQIGVNGIDLNTLKMFSILYVDGIVLFADNADHLQHTIYVLYEYCQKWKLTVINIKQQSILEKEVVYTIILV